MAYSEALEQQVGRIEFWRSRDSIPYAEQVQRGNLRVFGQSPSATDIRRGMVHELSQAETIYVAPEISRLIQSTAQALPPTKLSREMLPFDGGWVWLGEDIRLGGGLLDPKSHTVSDGCWLQGFTWGRVEYPAGADATQAEGDAARASRISLTSYVGDAPGSAHTNAISYYEWPFGDGWDNWGTVQHSDNIDQAAEIGVDERRFIMALFLFMQQRILIAPKHRAERHAVKRLERDGWTHEPLIRVVELRRKASSSKPSEDPKMVAWSHQWVVSGHWRQQPYPSLGIVQPRWIMPHLQGPAHLPLKAPRAKVFAVVR